MMTGVMSRNPLALQESSFLGDAGATGNDSITNKCYTASEKEANDCSNTVVADIPLEANESYVTSAPMKTNECYGTGAADISLEVNGSYVTSTPMKANEYYGTSAAILPLEKDSYRQENTTSCEDSNSASETENEYDYVH